MITGDGEKNDYSILDNGFDKLLRLGDNVPLANLLTTPELANVIYQGVTPSLVTTPTNTDFGKQVIVLPDTTSITPTPDTAFMNTHFNTQAAGTLTINAPTGTPTDGQKLLLRIKCSHIQSASWNAIYRFSLTVVAPTAFSGSSLTDIIGLIYNATDLRWDVTAVDYGH